MIPLHLEILDKARQDVFEKLGAFASNGSLAGGTAIALQIGHRISFDFDVFTHVPPTPQLWDKAKKVFGRGMLKTLSSKDQINFVTHQNIAVTFFYDERKPIHPMVQTNSIRLFDLQDLAGNKAYTIGKRGKWRDYVDLYFLLKTKTTTIEKIIENCTKRSSDEIFPTKLFLEQLVYFDDVDVQKIDFTGQQIPATDIQSYLSLKVKEYGNRFL